jgi:hypothetical protein
VDVVVVAALATVEARPSVKAATAVMIVFFIGESSRFKAVVRFLNWRYLTPSQKDQSWIYRAIANKKSHHRGATPDPLAARYERALHLPRVWDFKNVGPSKILRFDVQ